MLHEKIWQRSSYADTDTHSYIPQSVSSEDYILCGATLFRLEPIRHAELATLGKDTYPLHKQSA